MVVEGAGGWLVGVGLLAGFVLHAGRHQVDAGESRAKVAMSSSLGSAPNEIRQHAFDGKLDTYFASKDPAKLGDHLVMSFDSPVVVKSITVETGRPGGTDLLDGGNLEISIDGATFDRSASFDSKGSAHAEVEGRKVRAIRVQVDRDLGHPLIVREFAIDSELVKPFVHPVEFTVDTEDAPELKGWTEETARLCEQWYDALNDELPTENFRPTDHITLTMRRSYRGVAAAGNGRITGSVRYFEEHRDDRGAFIHETVHVIQNYRSRKNPGWLVEGVADYVRFFVYEPGKAGPVNPVTARYDASYRTTAAFLDYLSRTHDKEIVKKLNKVMREGTYDKAIFEQLCGKSVEALNEAWRASLRR